MSVIDDITRIHWRQAARDCSFDSALFPRAELWIDSIDIPIIRKKGRGPSSAYWSHKLKRPGLRYWVVRDGRGRVVHVQGGLSPKTFDADAVRADKVWYRTRARGVGIFGDEHFRLESTYVPECHWYTPHRAPSGARNRVVRLTGRQERWNSALRKARAVVETTLSHIKNFFSVLQTPWTEDLHLLDSAFYVSCAIKNIRTQ